MTAASLRVAVLGAGILGSSVALLLARRGVAVDLFDAADAPFSMASRWNEGKIHLGYLYNADPTLATARKILPGGLRFRPLLEGLLGCSLEPATTAEDDIFLCHRDSLVPPDAMHAHFLRIAELVRQHPDACKYLADASAGQVSRLTPRELGELTCSPDIVAGFRVPERSVSTNWVADRFVEALAAEPGIAQHMSTNILSVAPPATPATDGRWQVVSADARHGPYDFVVNALWQGRMGIDRTAGIEPVGAWSNRYRLALFVRTRQPLHLSSAIIATGAFGDVKNYNGRDFYLSWYPTGMILDSEAVMPPAPPLPDQAAGQAMSQAILAHLGHFLPGISALEAMMEHATLQGGWVHAAGRGAISRPESSLHRRTDFGITRLGAYISVDTGKYSTAPWLAGEIAEGILRH